jgi:hypothetical protein
MIGDLRGIAIVIFITLLAGAIAYAGDRVGHQIGRKRLTLYNIRPRYTSTIIAVGTGMVIALVVTLAAIFASSEVRIAIFQLSSISQQIETLKAREAELTTKVNSAQLLVPIGTAVSPQIARFAQNSTPEDRYAAAKDFYQRTVNAADSAFMPQLKKYVPPADVDARLHTLVEDPRVADRNKSEDIYVVAIADHNLFVGDRIDFTLTPFGDALIARKGAELARGKITSGTGVNFNLAIAQLQSNVVKNLIASGLPPYFAGTPAPVQFFPSQAEMTRELASGSTSYTISAFAFGDIFPHTFLQNGTIPIVVVAQPIK